MTPPIPQREPKLALPSSQYIAGIDPAGIDQIHFSMFTMCENGILQAVNMSKHISRDEAFEHDVKQQEIYFKAHTDKLQKFLKKFNIPL